MSPRAADILNKSVMTVVVVVPILGLLTAIVLLWNSYVHTSDVLLLIGMYSVTALGATIGYHRMLTHQGFETHRVIRAIFLILGCMAYVGSKPEDWAATHIKHHAHSDEEDDPHTPLAGLLHAHLGWLFSLESYADPKEYAPELLQDPVIRFVSKYSLLWVAITFLVPFAIGGWTGLLWGGVIRVFFTTHTTWSVNSICHTFGKRAFETTDESRNEWIVGLLAFGEGWHNNHHAFPRNAFHGMEWYQFDLSGIVIRVMEKMGLVWNVQRVSGETVEAQKARAQQSQSAIAELRRQVMQAVHHADEELKQFFSGVIDTSLSQVEHDREKLIALQHEATARLREIRLYIDRAEHPKRQKLMAYMMEVEKIKQSAKERVQRVALVTA